MIWFNIKKLEKKIRENELSDKEAFKYFLATSIFIVILGYAGTFEETYVTLFEFLTFVAIAIWGSYSIFKANSSGDGQDFFKRYFALSWVINVRIFVYMIIFGLPLFIVYYIISGDYESNTVTDSINISEEFVYMIIGSLINVIFYLLLTNSFRRVSHKISN